MSGYNNIWRLGHRILRPVVEATQVRVAAPVEECRVVVRRRTSDFGEEIVTKTRTCD